MGCVMPSLVMKRGRHTEITHSSSWRWKCTIVCHPQLLQRRQSAVTHSAVFSPRAPSQALVALPRTGGSSSTIKDCVVGALATGEADRTTYASKGLRKRPLEGSNEDVLAEVFGMVRSVSSFHSALQAFLKKGPLSRSSFRSHIPECSALTFRIVTADRDRNLVIADPLYGYIHVPARVKPFLDHPSVQRLRRVGQNSLADHVYPSLHGTRLAHSLGALHLATTAWTSTWRNTLPSVQQDLSAEFNLSANATEAWVRDLVACVALLHDIGHPPYSHALEQSFKSYFAREGIELDEPPTLPLHERVGLKIARQVLEPSLTDEEDDGRFKREVLGILYSSPDQPSWQSALHGLVAGIVDVDRLDYVQRDNLLAGAEYGTINYRKIVDNLQMLSHSNGFSIEPGARARDAIETLLYNRVQSFRNIYFHARVVATETALTRAFDFASKHLSSNAVAMESLNYIGPNGSFVDDSSVDTIIKQVYLSNPQPADKSAQDFRLHAESVLMRTKHFRLAWKRQEEYELIANQMCSELVEILSQIVDELPPDKHIAESVASNLLFTLSVHDPTVGLNALVEFLQNSCDLNLVLSRFLNETMSVVTTPQGEVGMKWECAFRQLPPTFGGTGELLLLQGAKPLAFTEASRVGALIPLLEATFPRIFILFMAQGRNDSLEKLDLRRLASQSFAKAFPNFVLQHLLPLFLTQTD
jgi:HD superfamily phosphohydrolase